MGVAHRVARPGTACVENDLDDSAIRLALEHGIASIGKNFTIDGLDTEQIMGAAKKRVLAFGYVVATVVEQWGAIHIPLDRPETVAHALQAKTS